MELNKIRQIFSKTIMRLSFGVVLGSSLGYAYYYFIGCDNSCSITSSPVISIIYGAFVGYIFVSPTK